ncbi:MAG: hemerythrin [Chloroflexi bacterium]|nr:hemerythrin [Chloroflexota bacterium]MBM4467255.1 hemerythrin [Chloroflexota bacterium]
MIPTETLKHEHQIILMVLDAAEREAQSIQASGKVQAERIEQMLDFFRNFADRCHHAKEEELLFVKMQERGMPVRGGPIAVMLQEHDEGRRRVRAVAEALSQARSGDVSAVASVRDNLSAYIQLLRAHIDKEDHILYPMADRLFTPEDQQALTEAFEKVEAEEIGEGVHERYHQLAHDLAKRAEGGSREGIAV